MQLIFPSAQGGPLVTNRIGELINTIAASISSQPLDLSLGGVQVVTLNVATTTFTFTNPFAAPLSHSFMLRCVQDGTGSRLVTWPGSVAWAGGVAPVLSTGINKIDVFSFNTINGGTNWLGFIAGIGY